MDATTPKLPKTIDWQVTYACQLRCTHCYTDSGRRASRKLPREQLLVIADKLVSMKVDSVLMVGGEPLLVPEIFEIVERLVRGCVNVVFYTNAIDLEQEHARQLADAGAEVHVSLDGATAERNDAIRGRLGAFDAAMRGLAQLNAVAEERRQAGLARLTFGLDYVLVRSNFSQMSDVCSRIAANFLQLSFVAFGAVIPIGLASEEAFTDELLTPAQMAQLRDPEFVAELRRALPAEIESLRMTDNQELQVHTQYGKMTAVYRYLMEVEPDGGVRGFAACEGIVGNLLSDDPETLWERCIARTNHPDIVRRLSVVQTPIEWAAAVRAIDRQFADAETLVRLRNRRAEVVS